MVPKVIEYLSDERAVSISACYYSSMVLIEEGEVFNFGGNSLVYGSYADAPSAMDYLAAYAPEEIVSLRGMGVVVMEMGDDNHTLVLTRDGTVLSFGEGNAGQLGHGDQEVHDEPKVVEALRGVRVVAVAAGSKHSLVLTDEGAVLSFGAGGRRQLGYSNFDPGITGQSDLCLTRPLVDDPVISLLC